MRGGAGNILQLGIVGYGVRLAAMSDAGAQIFRENGIADPALYLKEQLGDELRRRYGLKLEPEALYITGDDPTQITADYPAVDLLLDVWIIDLRLEPFALDQAKYRITYAAVLRLIDAKIVRPIDGKKGQVVADGTCTLIPEETANAPTYNEFLARGAQRLKHEFDIAAQFCIDDRSKVLTASPAP